MINNVSSMNADLATVDERIGIAGLGLAGLMQALGVGYSKKLVSKITLRGRQISIYTHSLLKLGMPEDKPSETCALGDLKVYVPAGVEREDCLKKGNGYLPMRKEGALISYLLDTDKGNIEVGYDHCWDALVEGKKGVTAVRGKKGKKKKGKKKGKEATLESLRDRKSVV